MAQDIHTIDAEGKTPGRLATMIVKLLIGKHKVSFTPNVDDGDYVQVVNAGKMVFTGKKLDQKKYYHHTGYAKGLRTKKMSTLWAEDPSEVLVRTVSRMLPKNKHRKNRLNRLEVTK